MYIVSMSLPEYVPITKEKSEIIDASKRQLISFFLPVLIRMREWTLLYSINRDGVSMQTFYAKAKNRDHTVILIKDEHDCIFGAYSTQFWHIQNGYYGSGENFVFTFVNEDDI